MKSWKRKKLIVLCLVLAAVLGFPGAATAQEVNDVNIVEDPNLFGELQMPGTIEGTGTYFEVNDSNYLNMTFESSEPVHLVLESVPEMVVMELEAAEGATSTQITLSGFLPSTTYYKYEDDYHNEVAFTTDPNGSYSYVQDLAEPHLVFIQTQAGTRYIPSDTTIGTWDAVNRIYTLTTDVYESIQIHEDNLTLDGAGYTVRGTGSGIGVYLYKRTGVTIENVNVQKFSTGIYLYYSGNNTLTGNTASDNYWGIYLYYSGNNTLIGNSASNNGYVIYGCGMYLYCSTGNTLIGNSASNNGSGIYVGYRSDNNTLTGNTANSNGDGIQVRTTTGNTLTNNTASNNIFGIRFFYCRNLTLRSNAMSANTYNFRIGGRSDFYFDNDIDTSNTVDGRPIWYLNGVSDNVFDGSTDAGTFYAINCNRITIKDLTLFNSYSGVFFWNTHDSTIENVLAANNVVGICVNKSSGNTLTGNTVNSNTDDGIYLDYYSSVNAVTGNTASNNVSGIKLCDSSDNTLSGNSVWNNAYGINFWESSGNTLTGNIFEENSNFGIMLRGGDNNQIYNNDFFYNNHQAYVSGGSGNVFNLDKPIGGNFWSDWTNPDADGDGFVDLPYVFNYGQDNLPLVRPIVGSLAPQEMIQSLIGQVISLNLQQGISNSLDAKLGAALQAIDDINANNDVAAISTLQAFINAVEAQRGNKIPEVDADALINAAQEIIDVLSGM